MFRKVGMAALVGALVAPLVVAPVGALEETTDDAVGAVEAVVSAAAVVDETTALAESAVTLPLMPDGRHIEVESADDEVEHAHADVALRSGTVALPGTPKMLILEGLPDGTHVAVRSRNGHAWSPWLELTASADEAPDGIRERRPGVGPIWIGDASHAEVALLEGAATSVRIVGLEDAEEAGAPVVQGIRAVVSAARSVAQTSSTSFIRPPAARAPRSCRSCGRWWSTTPPATPRRTPPPTCPPSCGPSGGTT
jgi:hypothetical protein